ncbi:unnamed protein product [Microthlaspi erraticum]|uniref:Uncharacterized protein n=1 Tax=Microthlaspi erraticum TaxID=1685480 RepID=A0A6D2K257_9BRAS|nr:unnamed protein product [Microthlaspi erraticum]CAA7042242.1 unnamed protein product [Microthlaspi erraticum]
MLHLDGFSQQELGQKITEFGITSPTTENKLSDPYPCNFMFKTSIGSSGKRTGYLRPETAQGTFLSFNSLFKYNHNRLPLAAFQIGEVFINERYARSDEVGSGAPLALTLERDSHVYIRDRDSGKKMKLSLQQATGVVDCLLKGSMSWEDVEKSLDV